jgi:hypothetical protein
MRKAGQYYFITAIDEQVHRDAGSCRNHACELEPKKGPT